MDLAALEGSRPDFAKSRARPVSGILRGGAIESCASFHKISASDSHYFKRVWKALLFVPFFPKIVSAVRTVTDLEVDSLDSSEKVGTPKFSDPIAALVSELWADL